MSDEQTTPAQGARCPLKCPAACWICGLVCTLVLIILGTGIMAQWTAWTRYKKLSADEYSITLYRKGAEPIQVPAGHYIKEFRVMRRVDIISNDGKSREIYYKPLRVVAKRK